MSRRRRLLQPMRSEQRTARTWRNRRGRALRRALRPVIASGPPSAPWADPAYQRILTDIAANLRGEYADPAPLVVLAPRQAGGRR